MCLHLWRHLIRKITIYFEKYFAAAVKNKGVIEGLWEEELRSPVVYKQRAGWLLN